MASIVFPPGWRLTDANGKPVSGGTLELLQSGTSTDLDTYSDLALSAAHEQPVVCDSGGLPAASGGTPALVYFDGSTNVKVVAKTAAGATLWTLDDIPPIALDTSTVPVANGGTGATTAAGARTELGAAAASDLTSTNSTVSTIAGERAALNGSSFSALAGYDTATPSLLEDVKEVCLQRHYSTTPSTTSLTTSIPADTSVPLVTEGTEIYTNSFTPTSASSRLIIEVKAGITPGAADRYGAIAIFVGSTCIAADFQFPEAGAGRSTSIYVKAQYTPGSTSAITISARAGDSGGSATLNPLFGSAANTFFEIRELLDT